MSSSTPIFPPLKNDLLLRAARGTQSGFEDILMQHLTFSQGKRQNEHPSGSCDKPDVIFLVIPPYR